MRNQRTVKGQEGTEKDREMGRKKKLCNECEEQEEEKRRGKAKVAIVDENDRVRGIIQQKN